VTDPARPGDVADVRLASRDGAALPSAQAARSGRALPYRQPAGWWLRRRGYVMYIVREATVLPIALWMVLFLVEIARLRQGQGGYQPLGGPLFVAFSVLCLAAVAWHAYTFLSLAGMIMRIPRGDREVPPRLIVGALFGALLVFTLIVGGLLIWGGA